MFYGKFTEIIVATCMHLYSCLLVLESTSPILIDVTFDLIDNTGIIDID